MTTMETAVTTQVYRVYIKAPATKVWSAITSREWTEKYGYGSWTDYDLRPGAPYRTHPSQDMIDASKAMGQELGDVIIDGEVVEADEPRRLVLTWRMLMDPSVAAEGFTKLTYELDEHEGVTRLTVTHELDNAPNLSAMVRGDGEFGGAGGGWAWILSDLKSLLETGESFSR